MGIPVHTAIPNFYLKCLINKQTMASFPLQLKDFMDDTLFNQINIKASLSNSLNTSPLPQYLKMNLNA